MERYFGDLVRLIFQGKEKNPIKVEGPEESIFMPAPTIETKIPQNSSIQLNSRDSERSTEVNRAMRHAGYGRPTPADTTGEKSEVWSGNVD